MDPSETLRLMRELADSIDKKLIDQPVSEFSLSVLSFSTAFGNLDYWLSSGGFLPIDWVIIDSGSLEARGRPTA